MDADRQTTLPGWHPIETAPRDIRGCFLIAPYPTGKGWTDPYFGWWDAKPGLWARWPHPFQPTLWHPFPEPPEMSP